MDKANLAEWILRRLVSPSRASEIVGDLLETKPNQARFRFWISIVRVLVFLKWRPVLAVVIAAIASSLFAWIPFSEVMIRLSLRHSSEASFYSAHAGRYIGWGMLAWISAIFSLIRFGPRSQLAQYSLVAALLSSAATCTYWLPHAMPVQISSAVIILMLCLCTSSSRRTLLTLSPSIAAGAAAGYFALNIPLNPRSQGIGWILLAELLTITLAECYTLSFTYRRLNLKSK